MLVDVNLLKGEREEKEKIYPMLSHSHMYICNAESFLHGKCIIASEYDQYHSK